MAMRSKEELLNASESYLEKKQKEKEQLIVSRHPDYPYTQQVQKATQARDSYKKSDDNVGLFEAIFTRKTMDDYRNSKQTLNKLNNDVDTAQSMLQSYRTAQTQKKYEGYTSAQLDKEIARLDNEARLVKNERPGLKGYLSALAYGDLDGAHNAIGSNSTAKDKLNSLENQRSQLKKLRDERKSQEEISKLPKKVVKLLDEYNNAEDAAENAYNSGMFFGSSSAAVSVAQSHEKDKQQTAEKLKSMGYDNYRELAEYRRYITDKQRVEESTAQARQFAEEHPVIASAGARVMNPAASVMGAAQGVKDFFKPSRTDLDYTSNSQGYEGTRVKEALDEGVVNTFDDGLLSKKTKAFLYQTAASSADSVIASHIPGGSAIIGAGAMASGISDSISNGASKPKAILTGALDGIFEGLFESISISQLRMFREMPVTGLKTALLNIAKGTVTNFSEEAMTEIADLAADYLINGGNSEYYQNVLSGMQNGLSESEAKKQASMNAARQVAEAGLGGALMGGVFGAGGSVIGGINYNEALKARGRQISESSSVDTMLKGAQDVQGNNTLAKLAEKIAATEEQKSRAQTAMNGIKQELIENGYGEHTSESTAKAIVKALAGEELTAFENSSIERVPIAMDILNSLHQSDSYSAENYQGGTYKNSEYKNLAKFENEFSEQTGRDVESLVGSAMSERLSALGEDQSVADVAGKAIIKDIKGEKLTHKERKALNESRYSERVRNEFSGDPEQFFSEWGEQTRSKAEELVQRRANPDMFKSEQKTEQKTDEGEMSPEAEEVRKLLFERTDGQNKEGFDKSFNDFYELGKDGRFEFDQVKNTEAATARFTDEMKKDAFEMGVADRVPIIKEVVTIEGGDAVVIDTENNQHKLSELNLNDSTAKTYAEAVKYKDATTANIFIQGYFPGSSLKAYKNGFDYFRAAGINSNLTFADFIKSDSAKSMLKFIEKSVAQKAFERGRQVSSESRKKAAAKKKAKADSTERAKGRYTNQTAANEVVDAFYEAVAAKTGMDIEKVQSVRAGKTEANAKFIPSAFKTIVSANANSEITDMIHEFGHAAAAYNESEYAQVINAIKDWYIESKGYSGFEDAVEAIQNSYANNVAQNGEFSRDEAVEEFVSESLAGLFSTDEGVDQFMDWLNDESGYKESQKKTVLQKLADIFKEIVDSIKQLISEGHLSRLAKDYAQMEADRAADIREKFLKALEGARENYKEQVKDGEGKYSAKEIDDEYMKLAQNPEQNAEELQRMVDKAAKAAGYNSPKLYHGTQAFGFTKFDLNKMDDGRSIFLTDNNKVAGSYSGADGTRAVSSTVKLPDNLSPVIIASELNANMPDYEKSNDYKYMAFTNNSRNLLIERNKTELEKIRMYLYLSPNLNKIAESHGKTLNQLNEELAKEYNPKENNLSTPLYLLANKGLFAGWRDVKVLELESNIRLAKQLSKMQTNEDAIVKVGLDGYDVETYSVSEAREMLSRSYGRGNYSLYSKTDNFVKIDCKGNYWNRLKYRADVSDFYTLSSGFHGYFLHNTFTDERLFFADTESGEYATVDEALEKLKSIQNDKSEMYSYAYLTKTREISKWAKLSGYDGVVFNNIIDNGGSGSDVAHDEKSNVYVDFYPSQVKSADAVTYDEDGNIIPLSERFNESNEDIRYSVTDDFEEIGADDFEEVGADDDFEVSDYNESLLKQNKVYAKLVSELERRISDLQLKISRGGIEHISDPAAVKRVALDLKNEYASKAKGVDIANKLQDLYDLIGNDRFITWDVVEAHAADIADDILSQSKYNEPVLSDYSREVLDDIKSVPIKLNENQKKEVASRYGSYGAFCRATFGSIKIRNDGLSLDQRWSELSSQYPNLFPADTSDADQPLLLFEAVQAMKNTYSDDYGFDMDSARDMLTSEIYEKFFEVPETKSLEAKYQRDLAAAKFDFNERINALKESQKKKAAEDRKAYRDALKENADNMRAEYDRKFMENKLRYEERARGLQDTVQKRQQRAYIARRVKTLNNMLKPKRQANNVYERNGSTGVVVGNVPEGLRKITALCCEIFTDDTAVFSRSKLTDLKEEYEKIQKMSQEGAGVISGSLDDAYAVVSEKILNMRENLDGKKLSSLSLDELNEVKDVLDHLMTIIKEETEIQVGDKKIKMAEVGGKAMRETEAKGSKKTRKIKTAEKLAVNNWKPVYFFRRLGGTFEKLFWDIQKGQDKYARNVTKGKDKFTELYEKYGADKWKDEEHTFTLHGANGEEEQIKLTVGQMMTIYAIWKRERRSGKKSLHLMSGGIVFEDQFVEQKDKKGKTVHVVDKSAHPISIDDIITITNKLGNERRGYVDEMVHFLSSDMSELGNEVSMNLYGFKMFNEEYYFPFNSAKNFLFQKFGEQGDSMLQALGFTNATKYGANNPLVLSEFDDVWLGHVERMSAYNAFVIPINSMSKLWNYKEGINKSMASAFETAYGAQYKEYFTQFMKDVNGSVVRDKREDFASPWIRRFKKNAVFASASVVIQQPSAVMRAMAYIDPKYFAATSTVNRVKMYEEAKKYSGVATLKEIGGFDIGGGATTVDWMQEIKKKPKAVKDKAKEFVSVKDSSYRDSILSAPAGKADEITWGHIWAAAKKKAQIEFGLKGEELNEKAAEIFNEVIELTQVYDSVMTRSGLMRGKTAMLQSLTAFLGEPTTSINMLQDAALSKDKKFAARVYAAVVAQVLLNSALKSIITAGRDDDEGENPFEKYIAQLVSSFLDDLNPATMIPFVKDIYSVMQGYDVNRTDMDIISSFISSVLLCFNDKKTLEEKITAVAGSVGGLTGIPARNIIRDINGLKNTAHAFKNQPTASAKGIGNAVEQELFPVLKNFNLFAPPSKGENLYAAFLNGDNEMYQRYAKQYTSGQKIKTALKEEIEADYKDGTIDETKAAELLGRIGYDSNEAYFDYIKKWNNELAGATSDEEEEEETDANAAFYDLDKLSKIEPKDSAGKVNASYSYLSDAVKSGDMSKITAEIEDLKKHGVGSDEIETKLKGYIKDYEPDVKTAIEDYEKGNFSAFDSTVKSLAAKYGISEKAIAGAIRSGADVNYQSIDGTYYALADIHTALDNRDASEAKRIAADIVQAKMDKYMEEDGLSYSEAKKKAYDSIRSSISSKWKQKYRDASASERREIEDVLWNSNIYYTWDQFSDTLERWLE